MSFLTKILSILISMCTPCCISGNTNLDNIAVDNNIRDIHESSFAPRNAYACKRNKAMPWCISADFDKEIEPWNYRHITNTPMPWKYNFTFNILDIKEVNDKTQTVKIMMYFRIRWLEPRLEINENSPAWSVPAAGIPYSTDILEHLWYPDLEIYGMEIFDGNNILKPAASVITYQTRIIKYNVLVDITISCKMNFDRYPLDSQECPFRISSFYGTDDVVTCNSNYEYDARNQRHLQYHLDVVPLPLMYQTYQTENGNFTYCGFNIILRRTRTQILFQVYVTSALFIIVSWVSFLIKPEVVPGRMGLLITIFLVLINIFNGVKSNAPASSSLNAVDLYLIVCIGHVFVALVEYAIILFLNRGSPSGIASNVETRGNFSTAKKPQTREHFKAWPNQDPSQNKLDLISLVVFPLFFALFNIIYVVIYY